MTPKKAHIFPLAEHHWYVEPEDCTEALLEVERFSGDIWDPACGGGNVVRACVRRRRRAVGTDLIDRGWDASGKHWRGALDFLETSGVSFLAPNIVTNPPFDRGATAERFIRHALAAPTVSKLAVFAELAFLGSDNRARGLFADLPPARVWILTPRPSCPPGDWLAEGNRAGGGRQEFCWLVWDRKTRGRSATIFGWARRPGVAT